MTKSIATTRIEISKSTIIYFFLTLFAAWFFYQIRSILVLVFISFILMTAVNPLARVARRHKVPIIIPMLVIYLLTLGLLSLVVSSLVPAVVEQSRSLIQNTPLYLQSIESNLNIKLAPNLANGYLSDVPTNLLKVATGLFSNLINIFAVFFITYYLVLERPRLHHYFASLFGNGDGEKRAEAFVLDMESKVGGWVRGELILMLIIGLLTYTSLMLLGIPYALPLGVLAGILEVVPNIGPTIAAVPAILMGLTISPLKGLGAMLTSILIQQLENNLIVPRIMESATGTRPLATILVLLSGYSVGGVIGAVLAMPIYLIALTMRKHLQTRNKQHNKAHT